MVELTLLTLFYRYLSAPLFSLYRDHWLFGDAFKFLRKIEMPRIFLGLDGVYESISPILAIFSDFLRMKCFLNSDFFEETMV